MVSKSATIHPLASIRGQLILGIGLILILALGIALVGYLSLLDLQTKVETLLTETIRSRELALEIENEFLLARQNEAEFLSNWRVLGFELVYTQYATANQTHLTNAEEKLAELRNLIKQTNNEDLQQVAFEADELQFVFKRYQGNFQDTVSKIEERTRSGGVEQTLKNQLDNLEQLVAPLPNAEFQHLIEQIRSSEKLYFSTGQLQDINTITLRVGDLIALAEASSPADLTAGETQINPAELTGQAEAYLITLKQVLDLASGIKGNVLLFQDEANESRDLTEHIVIKMQESLTQARAEQEIVNRQSTATLIVIVALVWGLGIFIAFLLIRRVVRPLNRLTLAAQQMGQGDLDQALTITSRDEFAVLANAFNVMATQLQDTIDSLEQRVDARTRRLEVVAALGSELGSILDFDKLLVELVNQVKEKFKYYHVHVYILDDDRQHLVMTEGVGEAGKVMKASGHSIPLNAPMSLVARAARTGKVAQTDNVRETVDWLPNPILPDTYSEMAVPIVLGWSGEVVGVLDVQDTEITGLDKSDEALLRALANNVAVAIRNARLFAQVEAALAESRTTQERYISQSWQKAQIVARGGQYSYLGPKAAPLDETKQQLMTAAKRQALTKNRPTVVTLTETDDENPDNPKPVVAPITLRDRIIGTLHLHPGDNKRQWTERDLVAIETVMSRLAQTAENLRLFEDTRERAGREQTIREITDKLRSAPDLDRLLDIATEELSQRLSVTHAKLDLGIEDALSVGGNGKMGPANGLNLTSSTLSE